MAMRCVSLRPFVYDNPAEAPAGYDVTAWYTHLGICPDCQPQN
jgi:hypothetical protein